MEKIARPRIIFYIMKPLLMLVFRILFKIRIEGRENIPQGLYVLISNHLGWIDPVLYLGVWPIAPKLVFIGNEATSTGDPLKRFLISLADNPLIPFSKRDRRSRLQALQTMIREGRNGRVIGFFPEGRVGKEGIMCPFHPGAFVAALKLNRPILPVGLAGVQNLYWRKAIHIRIGKPILPVPDETPDELTVRVHAAMRELIPPYPGDRPEPHHFKWLGTMFRVEKHPFPFDGSQAIYGPQDPDGFGAPIDAAAKTTEEHQEAAAASE